MQKMNDDLEKIKSRFAEEYQSFIDVGKGWHQIIINLDKALSKLDPNYKIYQIKEKFGGLRYYCSSDNNKLAREIISEAEKVADKTCENCGKSGTLVINNGWYYTCCVDCSSPESKLAGGIGFRSDDN